MTTTNGSLFRATRYKKLNISLLEDAKFPGLHSSGLPPSPTIENPGGVSYDMVSLILSSYASTPRSTPNSILVRTPLLAHAIPKR